MSFFEKTTLLPDDPILSLQVRFVSDQNPKKVNLGIGSYKDAEGNPLVLKAIRKAEALILEKNLNKEYLQIEGYPEFIKESMKLIFGEQSHKISDGTIFAAQTIGATAALRIAGEFLSQTSGRILYLPDPTWPNHRLIFSSANLKVEMYPYYNPVTHRLKIDEIYQTIQKMTPGSVILLHASCHNPTGLDPSKEEWKKLSTLIKKHQVIPFFDFAYQGLGHSLEEDAWALRYFVQEGHEMFVAYSFSKNMGLYGERVGLLSFVTENPEISRKVGSALKQIIRSMYSNPPLQGARIVTTVLQSPSLKQEWIEELNQMCKRINEMRKIFVETLKSKGFVEDLSFINQQIGIFSFCGLSKDQVIHLQQNYAIYMPANGRMNVAGLNLNNMDYVIDAFLRECQKS